MGKKKDTQSYGDIAFDDLDTLDTINTLGVGTANVADQESQDLAPTGYWPDEEIDYDTDLLNDPFVTSEEPDGPVVYLNKKDASVLDPENTSFESNGTDGTLLIVLHDKEVPGMLTYLREVGLKVARLFTDITEIKNGILLLEGKARIVVVDSGTGKLTGTSSRSQLLDFLGICDEDTSITMFYTDSSIKMDFEKALGKNNKAVKWARFISTVKLAAEVMSYGETYVYPSNIQSEVPQSKAALADYIGYKDIGAKESDRLPFKAFETMEIIENICNSTEGVLPSYPVKL